MMGDEKRPASEKEPQGALADEGNVESGSAGPGVPGRDGAPPAPQRPRKKWPMVVGVIAVGLVVAGAGFLVWHESPSFCNAICHEPMDPYVEGYYQDEALMAHVHQVADTTCLDCHEPKIDEQITEGLAWVRGDYSVGEDGMLTTVGVRSDAQMCATPDCHDFEGVVAATQDWGGEEGVNPHESHQGYQLDCSSCHSAHGQSMMYCNTCHDYQVPEGWAAPVQSAEPADKA